MTTLFLEALNELYKGNSKVVSIAFVEWWLLKYGDLYKDASKTHRLFSLAPDKDSGVAFRKAYYYLDELSEYHRLEAISSIAIKEYDVITQNKSKNDLIDWCLKYEKLGVEDAVAIYAMFTTEQSLKNDNFQVPTVDLEIDGNDFRDTTKFLELFDVYYELMEFIAKRFPDSLAAESEKRRANSVGEVVSGDVLPF